ncbi:MAG TPA: hypothetical protein VGQ76_07810 [Thermoanaerobaculia bacterium]|jgi:hypothetical protein|nr:hypothetical protein [Thermoanaerobaculia bacterium]
MIERAGSTPSPSQGSSTPKTLTESSQGARPEGRTKSVSPDQMQADLLAERTFSVGMGEIYFRSLADFMEFKVIAARERTTVAEYDVVMVLPGKSFFAPMATSSGTATRPKRLTVTLLYTRKNGEWSLSNLTYKDIQEVR